MADSESQWCRSLGWEEIKAEGPSCCSESMPSGMSFFLGWWQLILHGCLVGDAFAAARGGEDLYFWYQSWVCIWRCIELYLWMQYHWYRQSDLGHVVVMLPKCQNNNWVVRCTATLIHSSGKSKKKKKLRRLSLLIPHVTLVSCLSGLFCT